MYMLAWEEGLKTTYYLRSKAATRLEKSTICNNSPLYYSILLVHIYVIKQKVLENA